MDIWKRVLVYGICHSLEADAHFLEKLQSKTIHVEQKSKVCESLPWGQSLPLHFVTEVLMINTSNSWY